MLKRVKRTKVETAANDKALLQWQSNPALRKEFGEFRRYVAYEKIRARMSERHLPPAEEKSILAESNERGEKRLADLAVERRTGVADSSSPISQQLNEIEEAAWRAIERNLKIYHAVTKTLKPPAGVLAKAPNPRDGRVPSLGALCTMAEGLLHSVDVLRDPSTSDLGELESVVLRGLWALVEDMAMKGRPGAREKPFEKLGDRGRRSRKARQK